MKAWIDSLVAWEKDLFLLLNGSNSTYLDSVMFFISDRWPWIIFVVLFLFLLSYKQNLKEFGLFVLFMVLLVILADGISSGIIKQLVQRARPTHHAITHELVDTVLGHRGGGYGFISGHTTNFLAFATFTSLIFRNKWYTLISFLTALTVAYSRIYLGVHFITDVIPGIITGLLIGWFVYYLYVQGRISFLGVPRRDAKRCYLRPWYWTNYPAVLLTITFVFIWLFAPLFINFY